MALIMRFYNEVVADLEPSGRRYSIMIDRLGDDSEFIDVAYDWCRGYVLGIGTREVKWNEAMEAPELRTAFLAIFTMADPKRVWSDVAKDSKAYQALEALIGDLPHCAVQISEWWRKQRVALMYAAPNDFSTVGTVRRASPKVSVNAPCPCGSGKKYKRCCSTLRAV